jgi:hypothetical protein
LLAEDFRLPGSEGAIHARLCAPPVLLPEHSCTCSAPTPPGAARIYSEDLNAGQRIEEIEIVNPFQPEDA